jgi:hypothetical protein
MKRYSSELTAPTRKWQESFDEAWVFDRERYRNSLLTCIDNQHEVMADSRQLFGVRPARRRFFAGPPSLEQKKLSQAGALVKMKRERAAGQLGMQC